MTDANGIPLGLVVAGANVHDIRLLEENINDAWDRFPQFVDDPNRILPLYIEEAS